MFVSADGGRLQQPGFWGHHPQNLTISRGPDKPQNDIQEKARDIKVNNVHKIQPLSSCGLPPESRLLDLRVSAHNCPCGAMGPGLRRGDEI